jgi:hypothetical protein
MKQGNMWQKPILTWRDLMSPLPWQGVYTVEKMPKSWYFHANCQKVGDTKKKSASLFESLKLDLMKFL